MEEQIKRKPGRPAVVQKANVLAEAILMVPDSLASTSTIVSTSPSDLPSKVGHFIVVNTPTVKGVRVNLEKIRTYCKAGRNPTDVQVAWDAGLPSVYTFGSEEAAYEFLSLLDLHCL